MIELDDISIDQESDDAIASVFKLGGELDINSIPGHYKNEDYAIVKAILNYRDKLQEFLSSKFSEPKIKPVTDAMLDVTNTIEKLKFAKNMDGVQTLEPHERAYLNIAASLNQQYKNYIERMDNDGRTESDRCCHSSNEE